MNKVYSYARIAGYVYPAIAILPIIISLIVSALSIESSVSVNIVIQVLRQVIPSVLLNGIWIIFFILLIKSSLRKSRVIPPSCIALAGHTLGLINMVISFCAHIILLNNGPHDGTLDVSTLFGISAIFSYASAFVMAVAFIWLSFCFPKGSTLKTVSIIIAIIPLIERAIDLLFRFFIFDITHDIGTINTISLVLSIFWTLTSLITVTVFFLAFYKSKP